MGFNYQKLVKLHQLSREKGYIFSRAIFGPKSKLGVQYFENKDSISTKHLERLSEHYNVPLSYFFDNSEVTELPKEKRKQRGVIETIPSEDVDHLKEDIQRLRGIIAEKDEQILWLRKQTEKMFSTIQSLSQNKTDE